jgi:hypothetical protein
MQDRMIDTSTLFPGLGYFGATNSDCITVRVNDKIQGIRICLPAGHAYNLLNLKKLEILDTKGLIRLDESEIELSQSSVYNDDPKFGPQSLLQGKGIHTLSEREPWWQAEFRTPVEITQLRLYNRGDRWGTRARNVVIQVRIGVRWVEVRNPHTGQHLWGLLRQCADVAGPIPLSGDAATLRRQLLSAIAEKLSSPATALETLPWGSLLELVNMWDGGPLDDHELTLVAAWMTQVNGLPPLMPMSERLPSSNQVLRLQAQINRLAEIHCLGQFVVSRHGVQRSNLLSRRDAFLSGAEQLIHCLQAMDYQPMLSYGTLLGAVRDQSFIAHDDDLDLLMLCRASDSNAVAQEMTQVAEQLRLAGYRVEQMLPQSLNMHVTDQSLEVELDLFPCWRGSAGQGQVHLHMEKMAIRPIPENLVHPPGRVSLHTRQLPAPADPEAFLLERYGREWTTPNQFFEWPWPLSSNP